MKFKSIILVIFCLSICMRNSVYADCIYSSPLEKLEVMLPDKCGFCGTGCAGNMELHKGVDFKASEDEKVYTVCDGEVVYNTTEKAVYNSLVIIKHNCLNNEFYAYYGHILSGLKSTDTVEKGKEIGKVKIWKNEDGTENKENTHIHFGINLKYQPDNWGYAAKQEETCATLEENGWRNPIDFLGIGDQKLVVRDFYITNTRIIKNQLFGAQAKIYNNSDIDYQFESAALEIYDSANDLAVCRLQLDDSSKTIAPCGFLQLAGNTSNCQTNLTAGDYKVAVRIGNSNEWDTISEQKFTIATSPFSDIAADNPYFDAIVDLYQKGVIQGHPDGTFKPVDAINRAEAAKIIVKAAEAAMIQMEPMTSQELSEKFSDIDSEEWCKDKDGNSWCDEYIGKLYNCDSVSGYPDGRFRPGKTVSRAEMLKMVVLTFPPTDSLSTGSGTILSGAIGNFECRKKGYWFCEYTDRAERLEIRPLHNGSQFVSVNPQGLSDVVDVDNNEVSATREETVKAVYDAYKIKYRRDK